ncbi:MAG: aminopeptidase N, partial [Paracoccaceae bacterium]
HPTATRVVTTVIFDQTTTPKAQFALHGEGLKLISATIDGSPITPVVKDNILTCDVPDGRFTWVTEVEINPEANTALSGLYMSNGMYCTQCEAEGFRKITFYPDRPDVMSVFTVTVEGPHPVLLSNGNPVERGELDDGRHFVVWEDPFKKPAYLFALVAGDLAHIEDQFTTMSGRVVTLQIFAENKDLNKLAYAMTSLQ